MTPVLLRNPDLAHRTARALNRIGRQVGRELKAHVISRSGTKLCYELHYPGVERGEVLAILRLLISGCRSEEITPIMISHERERPRFGARRA